MLYPGKRAQPTDVIPGKGNYERSEGYTVCICNRLACKDADIASSTTVRRVHHAVLQGARTAVYIHSAE